MHNSVGVITNTEMCAMKGKTLGYVDYISVKLVVKDFKVLRRTSQKRHLIVDLKGGKCLL